MSAVYITAAASLVQGPRDIMRVGVGAHCLVFLVLRVDFLGAGLAGSLNSGSSRFSSSSSSSPLWKIRIMPGYQIEIYRVAPDIRPEKLYIVKPFFKT